jgi:hypothetical protein
MDDERLLAEALRAHAAGGVSTPGGTAGPAAGETAPGPASDVSPSGGSRLRDRFRPLARAKRGGPDGATETTARPDPSPGPGPTGPAGPARPGGPPTAVTGPGPGAPFGATGSPGVPPPGGRPAPRPAPRTPERPWPQAGARPPGRPGPPLPTGPVTRPGAPGVPHPRPAPGTGATGAVPTPGPGADATGPTPWTTARIAWWSGMALLAGGVVGALAAVGTLGLPG